MLGAGAGDAQPAGDVVKGNSSNSASGEQLATQSVARVSTGANTASDPLLEFSATGGPDTHFVLAAVAATLKAVRSGGAVSADGVKTSQQGRLTAVVQAGVAAAEAAAQSDATAGAPTTKTVIAACVAAALATGVDVDGTGSGVAAAAAAAAAKHNLWQAVEESVYSGLHTGPHTGSDWRVRCTCDCTCGAKPDVSGSGVEEGDRSNSLEGMMDPAMVQRREELHRSRHLSAMLAAVEDDLGDAVSPSSVVGGSSGQSRHRRRSEEQGESVDISVDEVFEGIVAVSSSDDDDDDAEGDEGDGSGHGDGGGSSSSNKRARRARYLAAAGVSAADAAAAEVEAELEAAILAQQTHRSSGPEAATARTGGSSSMSRQGSVASVRAASLAVGAKLRVSNKRKRMARSTSYHTRKHDFALANADRKRRARRSEQAQGQGRSHGNGNGNSKRHGPRWVVPVHWNRFIHHAPHAALARVQPMQPRQTMQLVVQVSCEMQLAKFRRAVSSNAPHASPCLALPRLASRRLVCRSCKKSVPLMSLQLELAVVWSLCTALPSPTCCMCARSDILQLSYGPSLLLTHLCASPSCCCCWGITATPLAHAS